MPHDREAEPAYAAEVGMPELEGHTLELRDGIDRGDLPAGEAPEYHRRRVRVPDPR